MFCVLGSVGPPPPKKHKLLASRDVTLAEAAKYGTLSDFNFFDRVRKALKNQEVYDNFLRCLLLFTNEIVSKSELLAVTAPFFSRHPELQRWLQEFLGITSGAAGGSPPIANSASSPPPAATPVHPSLGNGAHHRDQTPAHPPHPYSLLSSQGGIHIIFLNILSEHILIPQVCLLESICATNHSSLILILLIFL